MLRSWIFIAIATVQPIVSQQIYDVFNTTWDRKALFTYTNYGSNPINFASGVPAGDAVINISPGTVYQTMDGFGATLTDSSAELMANMKVGTALSTPKGFRG